MRVDQNYAFAFGSTRTKVIESRAKQLSRNLSGGRGSFASFDSGIVAEGPAECTNGQRIWTDRDGGGVCSRRDFVAGGFGQTGANRSTDSQYADLHFRQKWRARAYRCSWRIVRWWKGSSTGVP